MCKILKMGISSKGYMFNVINADIEITMSYVLEDNNNITNNRGFKLEHLGHGLEYNYYLLYVDLGRNTYGDFDEIFKTSSIMCEVNKAKRKLKLERIEDA